MDGNRIKNQVMAVFSIFMTLFYLGVGLYFTLNKNLNYIDKPVRYIFGFTLFLYGFYRGYRTYLQIKEAFFTMEEENEQ